MRVLITGASGFAGGHLARACASAGEDVVGLSRSGAIPNGCGEGRAVDLCDAAAVRAAFQRVRPDVVYHLAALTSVGRSWEEPGRTLSDNVAMTTAVLEAVRHEAPNARILWVSSCEVYGAPESLPVGEDAPLAPVNPYAVSKVCGDLLAAVYGGAHGLNVVRARPFNHSGPGQQPLFVMSSIARQVAAARAAGTDEIRIVTGNPDARRDFTDVRDVVRSYRLLTERSDSGVYNICSGRSISVSDQISVLRELLAPVSIEHEVDALRVRGHEIMDIYGSHERLTADTGWRPEIPLRQTLRDTVQWWEHELSRQPLHK